MVQLLPHKFCDSCYSGYGIGFSGSCLDNEGNAAIIGMYGPGVTAWLIAFSGYLHNTFTWVCTNSRAATSVDMVLPSSPMRTQLASAELRSLLAKHALIIGPITLSNGNRSNHYFNCKRVTLNSEGAALVGEVVLREIKRLPEKVEAIGGLTTGADPIIGSVMMVARQHGISLNGFYVRDHRKDHGTRHLVENAPPRGTNVVIVDDVVNGGGSVIKAIDGAEDEGCKVVAVITLVDRLEGGGDRIKARIKHYIPLYTLDDFRRELEECQHHTTTSEPLSAEVSR